MGRYLEGPPDPDMLSGLQSLARGAYNAVDAPFDVDDMLDPSAESEAANAVLCLSNPSLSTSWEIGEPSPWTWAAIFARFALHRLVRRTRSRDEANAVEATEMSVQVRMLRCIFGNPFRPVDAIPARLTSDVVALARGMYDARDFSAMPVLGDALQGAGCDNPDVLGHCREPNAVHVRGCWVVDLMLGKE